MGRARRTTQQERREQVTTAHTEPGEHWFDLYVSNKGRWLSITGDSPEPAIISHSGKIPALRIANDPEITEALIDAFEAIVDALRTRLGMLS